MTSSAQLLDRALLSSGGSRAEVFLFHTPALRGLLKRCADIPSSSHVHAGIMHVPCETARLCRHSSHAMASSESTSGSLAEPACLSWSCTFPCALSRVLPPRVSEVVGVAHIKAYAFDDSVLLSGANLSNTYFSMRQDRYYVFRDAPLLAQHIRSLVQASCARKPLL